MKYVSMLLERFARYKPEVEVDDDDNVVELVLRIPIKGNTLDIDEDDFLPFADTGS